MIGGFDIGIEQLLVNEVLQAQRLLTFSQVHEERDSSVSRLLSILFCHRVGQCFSETGFAGTVIAEQRKLFPVGLIEPLRHEFKTVDLLPGALGNKILLDIQIL